MWQSLRQTARQTEWGKQFAYGQMRSYEDFRQNVPLSSYEELFPYIERMMQGEANVLWPGRIKWFSKSSGTTNARSKFIPVSRDSLQTSHLRGGRDMLALYVKNNPTTRFFHGKGLSIGGTFHKTEGKAGDLCRGYFGGGGAKPAGLGAMAAHTAAQNCDAGALGR
ncbi:MAG: GH3 auxin-responsive promoter family protein [Microscillaceae bacterium]|nr:GH3 auxin-responsive promoter family protein [Microscillaceae bacterium]